MALLATFGFVTTLSWASVWFWLLCLIALVWARRHLDLNRARHEPILGPADADPDAVVMPKLTMLVAAKDEEANIGRCLDGILAQDYPNLEVIVANDRSEDATGAIINDFAARDERVKAVHVSHLTPGWAGKNHALHQAIGHATGELLCFTDADCSFHSGQLLRAAVCFARREDVDFLSVLPELEAKTFWEQVVQPPAGAIMVFWFPPEKVNNPQSPRAYANGAFMLMTRNAYDAIGGHDRVKTALNEDMHFARLAKRVGARLRVIRGGGMYSVRMYVGLRQIWNGWTRIFYAAFGTLPRLIVSVLFLSIFSLLPWVSLLVGTWLPGIGSALGLAGLAAVVAQQSVLWRFYRLSNTRPAWALSYPLGAALCLAMTLNAMTRHLGVKTRWRGTAYQGGAN